MRYSVLFCVILIIPIQLPGQPWNQPLTLWYSKPANHWNQALPVGNGKLGAMIFGGIPTEHIQLNEESIWTRRDTMMDQQGARKFIPKIREALFNEDIERAEEMAIKHVLSDRLPSNTNTYQTLGDLFIHFENHFSEHVRNYSRSLDLKNAIARVSYTIGETTYSREVISSAPDQVLAIRLSASQPGKLSFKIALNRPGNKAEIWIEDRCLKMREHVGDHRGVVFEAWLYPVIKGGAVIWSDTTFTVNQADEAELYLVAASNYFGHDLEKQCHQRIINISSQSYDRIYDKHRLDYKGLFDRVDIELGSSWSGFFTTDERVETIGRGFEDPDLVELYFQYGRYLLISSSRPGSLPANLQGIWCDGLYPPWNSDYHININLQMNYWPAEVTHLPECHEPLFDFIERLVPNGQRTAQTVYGCNGFVAHHTTDVWYPTSPFGLPVYGMWPMGAAWLVQHLWEHYLFNGDLAFLNDRAWPVMKAAALFISEFLVTDPVTGSYISGPSMSPENSYLSKNGHRVSLTMGPAMDHEIIYDLFTNCIQASEVLDIDQDFREKLLQIRSSLAPVKIGSDGRIMEWQKEYEETEPGHRHISHLFALHPGKQFTYEKTPEFMAAAAKTLDYRLQNGGGHTGWSRAWIINFYARLMHEKEAYSNIQALLGSSTLPNLLDNHPPFQIDGNFGGCAGIAEMLLQSHENFIRVLPALPEQWSDGYIHGLMARGGFEIDINWEGGKMTNTKIKSILGQYCRIVYGSISKEFETRKGGIYILNQDMELVHVSNEYIN